MWSIKEMFYKSAQTVWSLAWSIQLTLIYVIYYEINIPPLQYALAPNFETETDVSLTVDDKKVTINSKLTPGIIAGLPNIDFTATLPQGKSRLFLLLQVCTNFL
jgi:hypothetical protein